MLKRLSLALLSVLSLLFVAACGLTMYVNLCSNDWAGLEPWFGEEPEILSTSFSEYGTTWTMKEDRERLKQLAATLHAEPLSPDDDTPCSPDADEVVFETATPVRLCYTDGEIVTEPHHLRIFCEGNGTARVEWSEHPEWMKCSDDEKVIDVTAERSELRHDCLTSIQSEWDAVAAAIALIGPTLLVNAWLLLLLPHALDKRLLWYLLPLAYEGIQILYPLAFGDTSLMALAIPFLLLWPFFSLLQSLIFFGLVTLIHSIRPFRS